MRQTIEEACRQLGVARPGPIGNQLSPDELKRLFRGAPEGAHLWVTNAFHEVLDRIAPNQCFRFWRSNVQSRLMEDGVFVREAWPDRHAYLAQQWNSPFDEPLIELMRCE